MTLERSDVRAVGGDATVRLADDRTLSFAGLFFMPRSRVTSVPGVLACGDAAMLAGSVSFAVADGARAGMGAHASLIFK